MTDSLRVYTNPDVTGCEIGGAVKNVLALAAGIADGLGYGWNTKAALITRGLAELARLGVALGGQPLTFLGLAGNGDLMATCSSTQSRNHHVGAELGRRSGRLLVTPDGCAGLPGPGAPDAVGGTDMGRAGVESLDVRLRAEPGSPAAPESSPGFVLPESAFPGAPDFSG